jgi:predicted GNAT family acetyltransferase
VQSEELIVSEPIVSDNVAARRFEAHVDGRLAGVAEYQLTDELVVFTHTEVEPAFEGQGIGSAIARYALDQLRAGGTRKALPVCPFIKGWIERHPDYLDITYGARPSRAD